MNEFMQSLLLYQAAIDFFEESIDDKIAAYFNNFHQWYNPWKHDINRIAEVILDKFDDNKLYQGGIVFTKKNIEDFKNCDIPNALREALKKHNVTIDVKVESKKLWVRSK